MLQNSLGTSSVGDSARDAPSQAYFRTRRTTHTDVLVRYFLGQAPRLCTVLDNEDLMKTLLLLALAGCLICTACGGNSTGNSATTPPPTPAPTLTSIQISAASTTVPQGTTEPLTVTGTYSDNSTANLTSKVTWTSSATNIATVNAGGEVTGVSLGPVTITATKDSLSNSVSLTVGRAVLSRIDITPSGPSLPANTAIQLVALGTFTDGTTREVNDLVTWSGSDDTKVSVSSNGVATSLSSGTATVTATAGAISGSANVKVSTAQLVRLAILPYQPATGIGVLQHFVALGTFDDYTTSELVSVSWSSSDPSMATITTDGKATPLNSGSATITASVGAIQASTVLTILPATLLSVTVGPASSSIATGTDQQFVAQGILGDGSIMDLPAVDWKSSDSTVASVDANGRTLAVAPGTATVSASVAGITGSSTLTVTGATLDFITVAPAVPVVPVLAMKQLYAVGKFNDGSVQDITTVANWWSSNSSAVTVSKTGLSSTVAKGLTTISASLGDVWGSAPLQVSSLTVDSVEVIPATGTLPKGAKLQYSLLSHLSDGSATNLDAPRWLTSPITMATVSQTGLVTARTATVGKVYGETCCKTAYTQLTVTSAQATSLAIDADDLSIPQGAVQPLHAVATFSDSSVVDVSNAVHWTSSQPAVSLVDGAGNATAKSAGHTTITAVFGPVDGNTSTVSATTTLTIVPGSLTALTIAGNKSIALGQSQEFTALGAFSDSSTHAVPGLTWQSSDPSVAIVLPSGLVISTGQGSAVITAVSGSVQATASITVQ